VTDKPGVAVIMPVLNEQNYLEASVAAILTQNYDGPMEIVLALGPSVDNTNSVAASLVARDSRISTVPNPTGRTPEGLNAAIAATSMDVIVRVDAHCELSAGYIANAIATLERTGADNVGGIMDAQGVTAFECAVATAMSSPLGVGGAAFHTGGDEGQAETVYLGVFKRAALNRVGGYDPHFTRAQDWEMNYRIRSTGGLVWFNPLMRVTYRPRSSVATLAKQYFQYGQWRREVMRTHPDTVSKKSALRYFAPPCAVAGSLVGLVAGLLGWKLGYVLPVGYLAIEVVSSLALVTKAKRGAVWIPIVLFTMHISWGIGFLTSRPKR